MIDKLNIRSVFVLTLLTIIPAAVHAQEARSTVSGTITDQSGATLTSAQVRITNIDTGVILSAVSNDVGQYHLLFVNPGTYRLSAEMPGFRTFIRENILLTLGEAATLDVRMEVGSQADTVTVAAQAPLLDAEKADRGLSVDAEKPEQPAPHCASAQPDGHAGRPALSGQHRITPRSHHFRMARSRVFPSTEASRRARNFCWMGRRTT